LLLVFINDLGQFLIDYAEQSLRYEEANYTNCYDYDILNFNEPTPFIDIYTQYIKDSDFADPDINRALFNLNNTEQKLRAEYPPLLVGNTEYIPETLPVYAIANIMFLRYDLSVDTNNISGFIVNKLGHQIRVKQRGITLIKTKQVWFYQTKQGCCEKGCTRNKQITQAKIKRDKRTNITQQIKDELDLLYS